MKTRAAVALEKGKPLTVTEVDLDGPKASEVLVEVKAISVKSSARATPGRSTSPLSVRPICRSRCQHHFWHNYQKRFRLRHPNLSYCRRL